MADIQNRIASTEFLHGDLSFQLDLLRWEIGDEDLRDLAGDVEMRRTVKRRTLQVLWLRLHRSKFLTGLTSEHALRAILADEFFQSVHARTLWQEQQELWGRQADTPDARRFVSVVTEEWASVLGALTDTE